MLAWQIHTSRSTLPDLHFQMHTPQTLGDRYGVNPIVIDIVYFGGMP